MLNATLTPNGNSASARPAMESAQSGVKTEYSLRCRLLRIGAAAPAGALAFCLISAGGAHAQENAPRAVLHGISSRNANPVLEWNQIFVDTLIATNTANASSQRLGAIVHTAIFDAYDSIEQRYSPIFIHDRAPSGASRRAAVIAAGYTALAGLFPTQKPALDSGYAASLAALFQDEEDGGQSREPGIA